MQEQVVRSQLFLPMFEEHEGNVWDALETAGCALAHAVSADLAMGRGFALDVRRIFGDVTTLKAQKPTVGGIVSYTKSYKGGDHMIYHLVTKPVFFGKPSTQTIEQALVSLKRALHRDGITNVVMPRIGCGLDRMEWKTVRGMLVRLFGDDDKVTVRVYTPVVP